MPSKPLTLFKNCMGLHTGVDEIRAKYDANTGETFLAACQNVRVTRGYRVCRRNGYARKNATSLVAVFSDRVDCVALGSDGVLSRVNADWSLTGLRNRIHTDLEMHFAATPEGIFYNNGVERGQVRRFGPSFVWGRGAEEYAPIKSTELTGPPQGTILHYHNGRMFIADGRVVWYSDYRSYGNFHLEEGMLQYADNVIGFASAGKTLYVFTETAVYSLVGDTMKEAVEVFSSNVPCIKGTISYIDSINSEFATLPIWATRIGLFVGTRDGSVKNVTGDRLILPADIASGKAACFRGEYLAILSR